MTTKDLTLDGERWRVHRGEAEDGAVHVEWTDGDGEAGGSMEAAVLDASDGWVRLRRGERTHRARVLRRGDWIWVAVEGETYAFSTAPRTRAGAAAASDGKIEAPMPGALLEVLVEEGEEVEEGQDLLVVEAMKMEHRMRAPFAGTVRELAKAAGDRVEPGSPILVLEPREE